MDKKRCRAKNPDDPPNPPDPKNKSVTGLYYGKLGNFIAKKKIKCIYEPVEDYTESTGSLVDSESNLGKTSGKPFEVKIFSNEEASANRSFFNQEDLSKGCIKPSNGSGNSENLGIAIGLQTPAQGQSKNLTVAVEFDVTGGSSTSLTELKKYTSRMKLLEETPSKMIFNGIVKLQPRAEPLQITSVPLYIIDPDEKIVENPGFSVSYKTSAKSGNNLVVEKPMEVLVKLKVDKPSGEGGEPRSSLKQPKDCCCNKTKKTTISDIIMCRKHKSNDSIDGASKCGPKRESSTCNKKSCDENENPARPAFGTCVCDTNENSETDGENRRVGSCACKKTETNGKADAGTQSTANLQASQSNQTTSQVSVSSGKDLQSKSNQTNVTDEETKRQSKSIGQKSSVSIKEPQKSGNTTYVQSVQVVDNNKSKLDVKSDTSENKKSEMGLNTRRESKNQQLRREGWDRLEKRRSKEDQKLTSRNPNLTLRNTATQSSTNRITANKEISVQYSFIQPNYAFFDNSNVTGSSSTVTDSLIPVKSTQIDKIGPLSIASTSTQWPQSLSSSENRSQTTLTLLSDLNDYDKTENDLIAPTNSPSSGFPLSQEKDFSLATQTDQIKTPMTVNTYSQYLSYPVEDEIISLKLDEEKNCNDDIKRSPETLILLEKAKFKLGEYAQKQQFPYVQKPFSIGEEAEVCSIMQNEESEDQKSNGIPQYDNKETDVSQRARKQSMFTRFINHLKPTDAPVTIAQYHTICSTSTPFQLKPIPSLHDFQKTGAKKSNSFNSAKFELELKTMEIENVNNKLGEEIDSLQKIYNDLYTNVSFIYDNQDIFPIPPTIPKDTKKRSIKTIKSDISQTFIELNSCLSTIDKILSTASLKSVYETPPCTASTSWENNVAVNDAQLEDILSHEIQTTYMTVENDIKKTIKELLKESEYIKHQALLNGASEEPEPPFFFEYFDFLKEANPLLICKSIVDDLSNKQDSNTKQEEKEKKCTFGEKPKRFRQEDKDKVSGSKKSIGSCSRIKTDTDGSNKKDIKLKIDNKKNDRITYFCTTFVSKIPKTSFSFGGNSRALHRETRRIHKKENVADNVTSGDNAKIHEEDDEEFCKSWSLNIMEPNLNRKSDLGNFDPKNKVDENYEKNLSYANYIAYLNESNGLDDSAKDKKNVEEMEKDTLISNLLQGGITNEINVLQMQESVLTNDSFNFGSENSNEGAVTNEEGPKPSDQKKEIPAPQGAILKSPKNFLLAESFNRGNNLPSTSTTVYKRAETTDEEEVIHEMDLTKETHKTTEETTDELLRVNEYQPKRWSQDQHRKKSCLVEPSNLTTSSDEFVRRSPPKYVKKSKDLKVITVKPKPKAQFDSDSDETVLKLMKQQQNCPVNNCVLPGGSSIILRPTRANTNVCLQHSVNSTSNASVLTDLGVEYNSMMSFGNGQKTSANETDYDGDHETEQVPTSLPPRVYKSKQELNSPEEIARIEENVRQNDMLERRNLRLFFQSVSSESLYDDYSSTLNNPLLSDYSLSDSSPEIYSSGNNN